MTTTASHPTLALRAARPGDRPALDRLAALDSARALDGPVIVAEAGGDIIAARSLADGREIADPFRPAGAARDLLALRAVHLRADDGRARRRRFAARLLPSLVR